MTLPLNLIHSIPVYFITYSFISLPIVSLSPAMMKNLQNQGFLLVSVVSRAVPGTW